MLRNIISKVCYGTHASQQEVRSAVLKREEQDSLERVHTPRRTDGEHAPSVLLGTLSRSDNRRIRDSRREQREQERTERVTLEPLIQKAHFLISDPFRHSTRFFFFQKKGVRNLTVQ